MSTQYKKPPIEEAICDLAFAPSKKWSSTAHGLFYNKVKDRYPDDTDEQEGIEALVQVGPNGVISPQTKSLGRRVLLNNNSEGKRASIRENGLGTHSLKPYCGWDSFRSDILENIKVYSEIMNPVGVQRIGVRYINRIVLDSDQTGAAKLGDYFTVHPTSIQLPEGHQTYLSGFILRKNSIVSIDNEDFVIATSFVDGKSAGHTDNMSVILDIDVYKIWDTEPLAMGLVEKYIDLLRQIERDSFESLITPHAREVFNAI